MIGEPVTTSAPGAESDEIDTGLIRSDGFGSERTPRHPWTERDRIRLRAMCEEKLPSSDIAQRLGRTQRAVDAMSLRMGIRRHDTVRPWTEGECALLLRLHGEGASWAAIAEALPERSAIAVFRKLSHLVGPAPFKTVGQGKPEAAVAAPPTAERLIQFVPPRPPEPPPAVPVTVEAIVRWLRSRDFMVLHLEAQAGWRVDHRMLTSTEALLDFVNIRRSWLRLPPFELVATAPEASATPTVHPQQPVSALSSVSRRRFRRRGSPAGA